MKIMVIGVASMRLIAVKYGRKIIQRVDVWTTTSTFGQFLRVATDTFVNQYVIGLSQQIAYNILFSFAPLLIFLTGCLTLLAQWMNRDLDSPAQPIIHWINQNLPAEVASLIDAPLRSALDTDASALLSIGGVLALWTAKNAIASMMRGLNATYGIREMRPFLQHNGVAIGLTVCIVVSAIAISLLQLLGTRLGGEVADRLGFGDVWNTFVEDVQLPITLGVLVLALVTLHRFGPTFRGPFRWYLPGAIVTVLGVIVASLGFRLYFSLFSDVTAYGAFGALLVFLLFLYIVSMVILLGGVINASLLQTYPPAQRALKRFHEQHPGEAHTFEQLHQLRLPGSDVASS